MAASSTPTRESNDLKLVVERIFDAPRSLVFKAWIEPQHLLRWFGPRDYKVPSYTIDPRPGGSWRVCMVAPTGRENWVRGVFREVLEPERLVFTWAHENPDGTLGHETLITITFADLGAKTRLTLRQETFESVEARNEHNTGWTSTLECLAEYLATL